MEWVKFDADKVNPQLIEVIEKLGQEITLEVKKEATEIISLYKNGGEKNLNQTIIVDTFRPSEFDNITSNDNSLKTFLEWLVSQSIDWESGSETLKNTISKNFENVNGKTIEGGREKVILDNLIKVDNRIVAIEVESSNNLDNGYWTLRQAVKIGRADYGIMIVPWFPLGSGRADEGKALGRLDREFDGRLNSNEGPIYRVSPIRKIDTIIQLKK